MKILIDENLPKSLAKTFSEFSIEANHVSEFNLLKQNDNVIWSFAIKESMTIISKDNDFYSLSVLKGYPPKIIFLQIGNCSVSNLKNILLSKKEIILEFLENDVNGLLIIQK